MKITIELSNDDTRESIGRMAALLLDFVPGAKPVATAAEPPGPRVIVNPSAEQVAALFTADPPPFDAALASRLFGSDPTSPAEPTPVAQAQVDITGAPYDPAIHSSKRTLNADGSWRLKRASGAARPAEPVAAPVPPVPPVPTPPEPPAPSVPAVPLAPTYSQLAERIARHFAANRLTLDGMNNLLKGFGLTALPQLNSAHAHLIPSVWGRLTELGFQ